MRPSQRRRRRERGRSRSAEECSRQILALVRRLSKLHSKPPPPIDEHHPALVEIRQCREAIYREHGNAQDEYFELRLKLLEAEEDYIRVAIAEENYRREQDDGN